MTNEIRGRAKKKLLRITFPDGKMICYKSATDTMVAVLNELGPDVISKITLELCHLPLVSKEIYPKYKDWMKPLCNGWYLNAQTDSATKLMQLKSINDQLNLGLVIELSPDFEPQEAPAKEKRSKVKERLFVKLSDGYCITGNSSAETFLQVIRQIGVDNIMRKELSWGGNPLISATQKLKRQIKIDNNRWIVVPSTNREKIRLLRVIGAMMHFEMEISSQ